MRSFQLTGIASLSGARYRVGFADAAGTTVEYDFDVAPLNEFISEIRRSAQFERDCAPRDYENSWVNRVVADFANLRRHRVIPVSLTAVGDLEYRLVIATETGQSLTLDVAVPRHNAPADAIVVQRDAEARLRTAVSADGHDRLVAAVKEAVMRFDWQRSEPLTLVVKHEGSQASS